MNNDIQRPSGIVNDALKYAARGVAIFSTTADGKAPNISNDQWSAYLGREVRKGQGGLHQATTDPAVIQWMFSQRGAGGIGMPCGRINNVIVADFDIHKEDGTGNAHRQMDKWRDEIAEAHQVVTRNGGVHAYFLWEEGHGKHELGDNIDVQSDGSYVLLPPSKGYKVRWPVSVDDWSTPPWDAVPVKRATRGEMEALSSEEIRGMRRSLEIEGQWHNSMVRLVAHMFAVGCDDAEILRMATSWTVSGYTFQETFEEIYVALQGAKAKWGRVGRPLSREDRMRRWMDDYRMFDDETKEQAQAWIEKGNGQ